MCAKDADRVVSRAGERDVCAAAGVPHVAAAKELLPEDRELVQPMSPMLVTSAPIVSMSRSAASASVRCAQTSMVLLTERKLPNRKAAKAALLLRCFIAPVSKAAAATTGESPAAAPAIAGRTATRCKATLRSAATQLASASASAGSPTTSVRLVMLFYDLPTEPTHATCLLYHTLRMHTRVRSLSSHSLLSVLHFSAPPSPPNMPNMPPIAMPNNTNMLPPHGLR